MHYISTRGETTPMTFQDAVMTGLAPDGGLLLPEEIPEVDEAELDAWRDLEYPQLAAAVMRPFVDLSDVVLEDLVERSYESFREPEVAPVVPVGPLYMLELFHGPTLAFKDVALQFLGNLFALILETRHQQLNIIAATSGDTGSAAIHGVRGKPNIRIFVMHPHGRTSPMQALQMTSVLDDNVHNLAVHGTFDDCQSMLKTVFSDAHFKRRYALGAVNSINWARILAQVVYYFHAAFRVMEQESVDRVRFCVPTGNFGDIFAGYIAARMGLPIDRLVLASNENDILFRFFDQGLYTRGEVSPTLSPFHGYPGGKQF
jgi:threonine synthase